ncbi:catalase [Variibacter gotjawalensis]|uniref:Catalase n=1 Tax=Variibacter gotjawalensis TaxID=1333996 RepID=A0A0S3PRJ7_9BRAD|nr:catalase family protein [Variibacter gotjawalensis]NIK48873.1 catalase [Variibacter gotjawalensis]RZS50730.1 catalase [Variibacter gotjawalensis]BAT58566.1 catalase [Variibacter gotjawalensis]
MPLPQPIPFKPEVEQILPDEQTTIAGLNEAFDQILETTARNYKHAVRAVHAKSHGVLVATFTVNPNLPDHLAQGMFASPATYEAYVRLSTNAGDILPDVVSLPRGMAIKVVGVRGPRLSDAEGQSQDFVLVNGPVFQAPNAEKFLGKLKLLAKTTDKMESGKVALSSVLRGVNKALTAVGIESVAINAMGGAPNVDPLGETYFSVTPFRYGDFVAKFRLVPASADLKDRSGVEIDASDNENAIRDTVRAEVATINGRWNFQVQLCRDIEKQPIEDPTVEWKEDEAPFETVATLSIAAQDSWSAYNVRNIDEAMRFSVWTGIEAHQPLGNINRARKATYRHSSDFRQATNGCPIHEPR